MNFCHLKVAFQSPCKLGTLFCFIDTLDKKIHSDLVYLYSCNSYNATYHDKTYGYFFSRDAEHINISNITGKRIKNVKLSAVSDHLLKYHCTIDFYHFDILASDTNNTIDTISIPL